MEDERSLMDYWKSGDIDEEFNSQRITSQDTRDKRALLSGAAPLLVGILAGNTGDAAEIAGKALLDEDQRQLKEDSDLMGYIRKKKYAEEKGQTLKKRFQFPSFQDEEGNIKIAKGDTYTGEITPTKFTKGLSPRVGIDPTTGQLSRTTKGNANAIAKSIGTEGEEKARFTVKEEKDLRDVKKTFMADPEVKSSRKAITSSNRAIALLNSNNPVADQGITTIFPRMFGEVGNLAVQERAVFAGSPELTRRYDRLKQKWTEGSLTDEDRSDLIEVARIMDEYDRKNLTSLVQNYATSEKNITGMSPKDISNVIWPQTQFPKSTGKISDKVKKSPIRGNVVKKYYNGKVRNFKKTKDGWEEVD